MPSLQMIYASTSGHTEYVIERIVEVLHARLPSLSVTMTRAEQATVAMLHAGDTLLLASGSWNTHGIEGQMNPHMDAFLKNDAAEVELQGKKVMLVELGDDRYRYTAGAGTHLRAYVAEHGGEVLGTPLTIVNEPYHQDEKIRAWASELSTLLV